MWKFDKKLYSIVFIIAFLLLFISVSIYIFKFGNNGISNKVSDWGTFGNYIGGVSIPIISLLNLFVLVYISLIVSKQEDKRWQNQLIHEAYILLLNETKKVTLKEITQDNLILLNRFISSFSYQNSYLFDEKENDFNLLCEDFGEKIIRLETYLEKYFKIKETVDISQLRKAFVLNKEDNLDLELLLLSSSEYEISRHKLFSFIKSYITNKSIQSILKIDIKKEAVETERILIKSVKRQLEI